MRKRWKRNEMCFITAQHQKWSASVLKWQCTTRWAIDKDDSLPMNAYNWMIITYWSGRACINWFCFSELTIRLVLFQCRFHLVVVASFQFGAKRSEMWRFIFSKQNQFRFQNAMRALVPTRHLLLPRIWQCRKAQDIANVGMFGEANMQHTVRLECRYHWLGAIISMQLKAASFHIQEVSGRSIHSRICNILHLSEWQWSISMHSRSTHSWVGILIYEVQVMNAIGYNW